VRVVMIIVLVMRMLVRVRGGVLGVGCCGHKTRDRSATSGIF
jgi:hypothetical protein